MAHRLTMHHLALPVTNPFEEAIKTVPLKRLAEVTTQVIADPTLEQMVKDIWGWAVRGDLPEQITARLSMRQKQIMEIMSRGDNDGSNKTIGNEMGISDLTVKAHFREICVRYNLMSRTQAVAWYLRATGQIVEHITPVAQTHRSPQTGSSSNYRRRKD